MAASHVVELLDLVDEPATFGLERGPLLAHGRRLVVERLDLALEARTFPVDLGETFAHGGERRCEALALPLARGERALQRLELGTASGGFLADAPTKLLDAMALMLCLAERLLGAFELALAAFELGDDPRELGLDARDLVVGGIDAGGSRCLGGELLPGRALTLDGFAEGLLGMSPVLGRATERHLGLGENAGRLRASLGRREHLSVEGVEPLARGGALIEATLPAFRPPGSLAEQRPQARGREGARERLRLGREPLVLLRHLRLLLQGLELASQLRQHVGQPQQVLIEVRELALGSFLAAAVLGDARGFLDVFATVLGLGEQHLLELALADHGVQGAADAGLAQQLLHVEQPHDLAVDAVLRFARAEDRACDLDLAHRHRDLAGRVVDHELDLGHAEGGPRWRAGEDDVSHMAAAERPGTLLAEHPADGIDEVGLARAVRAHDDGHARDELEHRLVRERLEPADRDRPEEHVAGC